jgi:RNA polymerase sigma-70 factor (ECF subfamily)
LNAAVNPNACGRVEPGVRRRALQGGVGVEGVVESTDAALMARIQEGDDEAFATFVSRYERRFFRLAFSYLRNQEEALDAVQEAFIKVYRARAAWEPRAAPFTWAYKIVANHCIDLIRKRRGKTWSIDDTEEGETRDLHDTAAVDPLNAQIQREEAIRMREAIARLPARQREIIVLRHYEGLSLQEIAEAQDCALGTVKSSLHRALANLKGILEETGRAMHDTV